MCVPQPKVGVAPVGWSFDTLARAHVPARTLWGGASAYVCHGGRCPPPEGCDRLDPGLSPGVVVAVGGCAQYVGPTGRAFAWSRGEGGNTSNPRLSRVGGSRSLRGTRGHVVMFVLLVMFVGLTLSRSCLSYVVLLVLLVPPGPRWARFVRSPQAGAPRVSADIQRPICKNMHASARRARARS